jgi:site-specific DNA-methyltransferase (adenine-specific)
MTAPKAAVLRGDCVEVMRTLPADSIDAIVTDPPYGIAFMGKEWDGFGTPLGFQTWTEQWAREAFRVLKPGGHLVAFGGTRMYHRLATGIEDAGFEVRDMMSWLYGSGFPKSLDVSKAIDKAAGAERKVIGSRPLTGNGKTMKSGFHQPDGSGAGETAKADLHYFTAPSTEAAKKWEGWGTALKPAVEPIVLARKPLIGTVAANVLTHGTGAINIDASRIGTTDKFGGGAKGTSGFAGGYEHDGWTPGSAAGRWPANILFDEEAAAVLDQQSGNRPGGSFPKQRGKGVATAFGEGQPTPGGARQMNDSGGASRFFYVAKAGKKERNAGLDGKPRKAKIFNGKSSESAPSEDIAGSVADKFSTAPQANTHPTVKPIALMGYLIKMVTPPGGVVLDPFLGSGSTACAAIVNGFDCIGIEQNKEYADIAEARIAHWAKEAK